MNAKSDIQNNVDAASDFLQKKTKHHMLSSIEIVDETHNIDLHQYDIEIDWGSTPRAPMSGYDP